MDCDHTGAGGRGAFDLERSRVDVGGAAVGVIAGEDQDTRAVLDDSDLPGGVADRAGEDGGSRSEVAEDSLAAGDGIIDDPQAGEGVDVGGGAVEIKAVTGGDGQGPLPRALASPGFAACRRRGRSGQYSY